VIWSVTSKTASNSTSSRFASTTKSQNQSSNPRDTDYVDEGGGDVQMIGTRCSAEPRTRSCNPAMKPGRSGRATDASDLRARSPPREERSSVVVIAPLGQRPLHSHMSRYARGKIGKQAAVADRDSPRGCRSQGGEDASSISTIRIIRSINLVSVRTAKWT